MCYDMVIIIGEVEGNANMGFDRNSHWSILPWTYDLRNCRKKGYSALAGFLIGLVLPVIGLIYEAGRTVSEAKQKEHDMKLAQMIADEMGKREKSAIEE